ncbi:Fanconi anemia group J like protein [Dictyocoela muelleri]|nr:Fanconi anemia group J like protein [Dictyocoela muelleri]
MKIKIENHTIEIPYNPYKSQLISIKTIINAITTQKNAIIESPTGTGKSLSIICGALSPINNSTIYICSRTHKQLDQLVQQLKKSEYRPNISIYSSRAFSCIHPKLIRVPDKNLACKDLIKMNQCVYYSNKDKLAKHMDSFVDKVFDIEDLCNEGKKLLGCPYYASTKIAEKAKVIFAPYNYLIDPNIRKSMAISLKNAVVIIDEAHNIDDVCRSAGSCEINTKLLDILLSEIVSVLRKGQCKSKTQIMDFVNFFKMINNEIKDIDQKNLKKNIIKTETSKVNDLKSTLLNKNNRRLEITKKGDEILSFLENMGITPDYLKNIRSSLTTINTNNEMSITFLQNVENIVFVIENIFRLSKSYCMHLIRKGTSGKKLITVDFDLNFYLMDASVIFKPFSDKCNSVILLSGTLTPFENVKSELGVDFPYSVTAPHVISEKNLFVRRIVGEEFLGTYNFNNTDSYLKEIVNVVVKVARTVNGGVLVFVPSYSFIDNLKRVINRLKENIGGKENKTNTIENKINSKYEFSDCTKNGKIAKVFNNYDKLDSLTFLYESKVNQNEFETLLSCHETLTKRKNSSSILICVYRGRASEGVDFKDSLARAVIAVGIPYPNVKDTQVMFKREFNDKYKPGSNWYEVQAFRAVNQAIGRVVRHINDWGSIFFVDTRYKHLRNVNMISSWARGPNVNRLEDCENELKVFVKEHFDDKD